MTTPLRQQYLQIKKQFPDTIVFFRLGDFYESFDEDAKKVAAACNIVLTARDMGTAQRVPLAGVPYHALDTYLARIINAGHKVAIVEQTSDEAVNGLMTREVVRGVRHHSIPSRHLRSSMQLTQGLSSELGLSQSSIQALLREIKSSTSMSDVLDRLLSRGN
jgi:DNA mismatch repair protein MutS